MASIPTASSFAGSAPNGAATNAAMGIVPGSTPPAAGTGTVPGSVAQGSSNETSDGFLLLLAEMIGGGAAPSQSPPVMADLAALSSASGELETIASDSTDTNLDDTETEEAGALALAALLPGMTGLPAPAPAAGASADGTVAGAGAGANLDALSTSVAAARVAIEGSQAAIDELTGDTPATPDTADRSTQKAPVETNATGTQTPNAPTNMHALLASHAAVDVDVAPDGTLRSAVGTPAWKDELGAQVTWLANTGREAASLRLSPENLGPVEVKISMKDGEASVWFGATNPDTRSALEQSLPRLRELFASQGLVLADSGVFRDAPRNPFRPATFSEGPRGSSDASSAPTVTSVTFSRAGLIDTYV